MAEIALQSSGKTCQTLSSDYNLEVCNYINHNCLYADGSDAHTSCHANSSTNQVYTHMPMPAMPTIKCESQAHVHAHAHVVYSPISESESESASGKIKTPPKRRTQIGICETRHHRPAAARRTSCSGSASRATQIRDARRTSRPMRAIATPPGSRDHNENDACAPASPLHAPRLISHLHVPSLAQQSLKVVMRSPLQNLASTLPEPSCRWQTHVWTTQQLR